MTTTIDKLTKQALKQMEAKLARGEPLRPTELNMLNRMKAGIAPDGSQDMADNKARLAEALGISRSYLYKILKRKGAPKARSNGKWSVHEVRAFMDAQGFEHSKSDAPETEINLDDPSKFVPTTKDEAQIQKIMLESKKLQITNDRLLGRYIEREEVRRQGARVGLALRKVIMKLHKMAAKLEGLRAAEIEKELMGVEDKLLREIATLEIPPATDNEKES